MEVYLKDINIWEKPLYHKISEKETSPYLIQLFNTEGGRWEDAYPFKNVVRYYTSATGHQSGEPMNFRIWPVGDPDYLELRYAGGNEGTFSWESTEDAKSIINDGSTLFPLEASMTHVIVILISILQCLVLQYKH